MTDSGLDVKQGPMRKAKVFRGARERIVKTDENLARTSRRLSSSNAELQSIKDALRNPILEKFSDDVQREISALISRDIAHMICAAISEDKSLFRSLTGESLRSLSRETGDNLAGYLADLILPEMEMSVGARAAPYEAETIIETQVLIPCISRHFHHQLPRF